MEWGIWIRQHYRPAVMLPIQPQYQLSWAELTDLFSLHHLRSDLSWMHKHADPQSPQTCKIFMTARAAGAISIPDADLGRYYPTVSNQNHIPHDSVLFSLMPVGHPWHTRKHLAGPQWILVLSKKDQLKKQNAAVTKNLILPFCRSNAGRHKKCIFPFWLSKLCLRKPRK